MGSLDRSAQTDSAEKATLRTIALVVAAAVVLAMLFAVFATAKPWSITQLGGQEYGSSMRRAIDTNGGGKCSTVPGAEGVWWCGIADDIGGDYSAYLLQETDSEGCWKAYYFDESFKPDSRRRIGGVAASGCAGITDTFGLFNDDDPMIPPPKGFSESSEFRKWAAGSEAD